MAYIPDIAIKVMYKELSPIGMALYFYYCKKRNTKTGGWNCPKETVLRELEGITEPTYFRAKKELISKKWIVAVKDFITPIFGFETIKNDSGETLKIESPTIKNDSETIKNDSGTEVANKDLFFTSPNTNSFNQGEKNAPAQDFGAEIADELFGEPQEPELSAEDVFTRTVLDGLRDRLKIFNEYDFSVQMEKIWNAKIFTAEMCLETYDLLDKIRLLKKAKWRIKAPYWAESVPHLESLREELQELENGEQNDNRTGNNYRQTPNSTNPDQANPGKSSDDYLAEWGHPGVNVSMR